MTGQGIASKVVSGQEISLRNLADALYSTVTLLSAPGSLTAEDLKLNVPLYNSAQNFQNISQRTFGGEFHGDK